MKDSRFIKSIRLRNLLSFGPDNEEFELKPLNVLIGPNASGKSNFIEAFNILRAAPRDIIIPFHEGGGIEEWIWKGEKKNKSIEIEIIVSPLLVGAIGTTSVCYKIVIGISANHLFIDKEIIKKEHSQNDEDFFYKYQNGKAVIKKYTGAFPTTEYIQYQLNVITEFNERLSILSQFKDSLSYPEITNFGKILEKVKLYRNFNTGIDNKIRLPQKTDFPSDFLSESLNNFALILNDLKERRETKKIIVEKLGQFYNDFDDFKAEIKGGTIQISFYEKSLKDPIPATRLSDGTLRYLCLLMILCHPEPPPLICIEEPEIGLHPDIMPTIAELLVEASKRTQLIVTTHSDILVSALSETPESVLVCEHDDAGSHLRRLDEKKLKVWLEDYSLGELWLKGEIGGNRW